MKKDEAGRRTYPTSPASTFRDATRANTEARAAENMRRDPVGIEEEMVRSVKFSGIERERS